MTLDYAFHLACYHGNQSSIANPLADHENNTLTTLKLFERLKDIESLRKVVYAAAGCAVAEKTYDDAVATTEEAPVSLFHDSPYSISKLIGEMYGNYYHRTHGLPFVKARFPERVWSLGRFLAPGVGGELRIRFGETLPPHSFGNLLIMRLCLWRTKDAQVGISFSWRIWQMD